MADPGRRPIPARNLRPTRSVARWLAESRVTPNQVSMFGLVVGCGSGLALALTSVVPALAPALWIAAAGMVALRGLANMLDGMIAVEQHRAGPTGILYNELPDRLSDMALFVGAGYSVGGSPTAGWLTACLALFVAYVRAVGSIAGGPADFGGPLAKQQRMFSVATVAAVLAFLPSDWRAFFGPAAAWGPMAAWLWLMVPGIAVTGYLRLGRIASALNAATVASETTRTE